MAANDLADIFGHTSLAVYAAERGLDAAERLGDPALIGFAGWTRGGALERVGARRRSVRFVAPRVSAGAASPVNAQFSRESALPYHCPVCFHSS
jgi:hypothetical protein